MENNYRYFFAEEKNTIFYEDGVLFEEQTNKMWKWKRQKKPPVVPIEVFFVENYLVFLT